MPENSKVTSRFITFNCLTPKYARSDWFPGANHKYLSEEFRKDKLKQLLKSFFKVNFVIALQELCEEWSLVIQQLCEVNNYTMVYRSYKDGVMGVGILYPHNHYDLLATDFTCLPETVSDKIKLISYQNPSSEVVKEHKLAENKSLGNIIISVLLRCLSKGIDSGKEIIVSTYHMPCRFSYIRYMVCQTNEVLSYMKILKEKWETDETLNRNDYEKPDSISTILMGDFNIHPKTISYKVLTNSFKFDNKCKEIEDVSKSYLKIATDFNDVANLRSAHQVFKGSEPAFTNVKLKNPTDDKSEDFIECLDYIMISDNIEVKSVQVGLTPKEGEPVKAYPNAICPSDHLPLSASLILN
jgi:mRNA deadenylase 3'-5' endonuclease subunit Ccr4